MQTLAYFYFSNCPILISLYTLRNSLKTTIEFKKKNKKKIYKSSTRKKCVLFLICIDILRKISFVDPCFEIQQIELNCFNFF